jgi:hypothetical protein
MLEILFNTITDYQKDFLILDAIFKYKTLAKRKVVIALTGAITKIGRYSRSDFITYINNRYEGEFEFIESKALTSCEFIVADKPSDSNTYTAGLERNKSEARKVLVSSEEFIATFDGRCFANDQRVV